nr:hypothetical protein [uncultured Desulfobulbus sp.]
MQSVRYFAHSPKTLVHTAAVLLAMHAVVQTSQAEDELRAGAVLQIPFSLGSGNAPIDFSGLRLGLSCQYADVDDDDLYRTRELTRTYVDDVLQSETSNITVNGRKSGDRVYGLEGNVFFDLLDGFTPSAELLGFYGNNEIQGALGGGYDFSDGLFVDAKLMFPYSEIGVRFPNTVEIYGGLKTLGSFDPDRDIHQREVTTDINTTTFE